MTKILRVGLSAGHGGPLHASDCAHGGHCRACGTKAGLRYGLPVEADYTRDMVDRLIDIIPCLIVIEPLNAPGETISPAMRGERARRAKCDLVLSVHVNESPTPNAHGAHMMYLDGPTSRIARAVAQTIAMSWPHQLRRGLYHSVLKDGTYVAGMVEPAEKIRWPDAHSLLTDYLPVPTVLVEAFYAGNERDAKAAQRFGVQTQMLAAMLAGIGHAYDMHEPGGV